METQNNFLQVGQTSECSNCRPEKGYLDENLVFEEHGIKCKCICHEPEQKEIRHENWCDTQTVSCDCGAFTKTPRDVYKESQNTGDTVTYTSRSEQHCNMAGCQGLCGICPKPDNCEENNPFEKIVSRRFDNKVRTLPYNLIPGGVSGWKNYGDKYHYTEFWRKEILKDLKLKIEELKKRYRCAADNGAKCEHTFCCQALDKVKELLK